MGAYPAPATANVRPLVRTVRAVISFFVSVPVLSEQIVVTEPSVSTAGSLRVIARRRAICCTPSASVIVTSAGRPSGTAATAKPIDAEMSSGTVKSWKTRPMITMTTAIARMSTASSLPNRSSWRVSGVARLRTSEIIVWIRPISVAVPVAVTTPTPWPAATSVLEKSMLDRSPTPASAPTASTFLAAATDSPVRADSSTRRFVAWISRTSAGTRSPERTRTTSPGTTSSASTRAHAPSRRTSALTDSMFRMPSSALSARPSWMNPIAALITATARITVKSTQSPRIALSTAETSRM